MAEVLDDGEFWLPPQFLADDDLFMDKSDANNSPKSLLPSEFNKSFGFTLDLSSPVESVVGSTETESDEEDYLLGLTRQMARYTLEDDFGGNDRVLASENTKDRVLSSSPESTLCCKQESTRVSSNCQSRVPWPPRTLALPYTAAEEAARVGMNEEPYGGFNSKGQSGPGPAAKNPSGIYPHQSLSNQKLGATQLQQGQLMKQHNAQVWGGKNHEHVVHQNSNRPLGLLPSAWPPLQQQSKPQYGSGMRAVFLGNPNGKRECAGTGVFLPRRIGTTQPRKKQACSTALVPARVIEALNLNLDEINAQPQLHPRFKAGVTTGNGFANPKQLKFRAEPGISQEIRLPQEWTY